MNSATDHIPDLVFLRAQPEGWLARPPLPAALQTFETSLIAVALGRYHTALVLTVSAAESALKACLNIALPTFDAPKGKDLTLPGLIKEALVRNIDLGAFAPELIEKLKNKRNRMTHFGHAPSDNAECAELLLDIAYPLFSSILKQGFAFDLTETGFLPDPATHWEKVFDLRSKTKGLGIPASDCFVGLGHFLRRNLSPTFLSDREQAMSAHAWEVGSDFDFLQNRLKILERKYTHYWLTDCPCCNEMGCLALDLIFEDRGFNVGVRRAMCVHCDWVVPAIGPVATILFSDQVAAHLLQIIKDYDLHA